MIGTAPASSPREQSSHLGRFELDLMLAFRVPDDQPDVSVSGADGWTMAIRDARGAE